MSCKGGVFVICCRQHFLQCPPGLLGKHFEKLIHCDPRLNFLSKQPEILLESPYFESRISGFDGLDDAGHSIELKSEEVPTIFRLQDQSSPSTVQSPSCFNEQDFGIRASDNFCQGTPSPSSVREAHVIEEIRGSRAKEWDRINFPELNASMLMTNLVDHIGNCITEQMTASVESQNILEEITQYLLNDSQHTTASDEKSLMSRVNSLYCLLQKDSATEYGSSLVPMDDVAGSKLSHPMSRKDSIGDLLLNLPRIASMPKFLFNTLEDSDIKSRASKKNVL